MASKPNLALSPATGHATASLTISVSTQVWTHWARIATREAERSRKAADRAPTGNVIDEMHPAMIAIAATAFALDGLYDQLQFAAPKFKGRPRRQRMILETLKRGFKLGKKGHSWLSEFDWLFNLRDPAVHPEQKSAPPVAHPSGWGNMAAEYVEYSADSAETALALLRDVLRTCVENPRPATEDWADVVRKTVVPEIGA